MGVVEPESECWGWLSRSANFSRKSVVWQGGCVWYAKRIRRKTSETQLIKYVPGRHRQECVCGFSGVSLFFSNFFGVGCNLREIGLGG